MIVRNAPIAGTVIWLPSGRCDDHHKTVEYGPSMVLKRIVLDIDSELYAWDACISAAKRPGKLGWEQFH
jgi:hypothetical protein